MTDERRDDEILGQALARAVDTQATRETPYAESRLARRIATPPRPVWQLVLAAGSLAFAGLVVASVMLPRRAPDLPAAVAPSATAPAPTSSPATSPQPTPTASAPATPTPPPASALQRVYFARDGLPPVGVNVSGPADSATREQRIGSRLMALTSPTTAVVLPPGTSTAVVPGRIQGIAVEAVDGDRVTVDFVVGAAGDWGVRGAAQAQALLQQLVYTATEEPGIKRVLITQNGGGRTTIDQLTIDKPLSREDVFGYAAPGKQETIADRSGDVLADLVAWRTSVDDVAPGMARFVAELRPQAPTGPQYLPRLGATLREVAGALDPGQGKWEIRLELADAVWPETPGETFKCCALQLVERTPLRAVSAFPLNGAGERRGVGFDIALDDERPWRVAVLHDPLRVVVDVGGHPQAVSDSVAVYGPRVGAEVGRSFVISGMARAFEGTVTWRLRDGGGRVVANGFTTASLGSSPVWGTFQATVNVPPAVSGNATLEVYWPSPRDGADTGLVKIPVRVP